MKNIALGMSLLVGGLLAVSSARAQCGGCAAQAGGTQGELKTAQAVDKEIKVQTTCPVMGGKVNKNLFVDHGGKRIYVCCQGCIPTVQKNPAKYIKALEASGVTLDPAGKPVKGK